jgi:hypothetical protein
MADLSDPFLKNSRKSTIIFISVITTILFTGKTKFDHRNPKWWPKIKSKEKQKQNGKILKNH